MHGEARGTYNTLTVEHQGRRPLRRIMCTLE